MISSTGNKATNGFTGSEQGLENRYIQLGARTYDPTMGRFLSVDPMFEAYPGLTLYHYCFNSPMIWKDPSGMSSQLEFEKMNDDGTTYTIISYAITYEFIAASPLHPQVLKTDIYTNRVRLGGGSSSSGSAGSILLSGKSEQGSGLRTRYPWQTNDADLSPGAWRESYISFKHTNSGVNVTVYTNFALSNDGMINTFQKISSTLDAINEDDCGQQKLDDFAKNDIPLVFDVSKNASTLANMWNQYKGSTWKKLAGITKSKWLRAWESNPKEWTYVQNGKNPFEKGRIYLATELIDGSRIENYKFEFFDGKNIKIAWDNLLTVGSHEFGHFWDSYFAVGPLDSEASADTLKERVYNINNYPLFFIRRR